MNKNLVIVESPSKAKIIKKYLGNNYIVKASIGHIIDLPKSNLGVDIDNNFKPHYITVRGKANILKEIKEAYKKSNKIFLATDFDREGEAIAWHLQNILNINNRSSCRIIFNEITEKSIKEAIKNPVVINKNLVDAQQSRRILDRIVGYKLSPLLWKKIKKGLSAGRVQSVALQIIIDREKEINIFKEQEYWTISSKIRTKDNEIFDSELIKVYNKKIILKNISEAEELVKEIQNENLKVKQILKKEKKRNTLPPFITSTLQQKASQVLNFSSKKTMQISQQLYEGIDIGKKMGGLVGLITYMRTDSTRVSMEAKKEARNYLLKTFGQNYLPNKIIYFKINKRSQDSHEAIRPTSILNTPNDLKNVLTKDQFKLYELIWKRFLASEMTPASYDQVVIELIAGKYLFKSIGLKMKFEGFLKVLPELKSENKFLPEINLMTKVYFEKIEKQQHFTKPPLRYSEATLIKQLESLNIGRPSTYANILDTIQKRTYVLKEKKQFYATQLGFLVGDLLYNYFKDVINIKFTSDMENQLDLIADGKLKWKEIIKEFYGPFSKVLEKAEKDIKKINIKSDEIKKTDILCEKCGRNMIIKNGRYGDFLACPGFPECKNTKTIIKNLGVKCTECEGDIIVKRSKKGKIFYGCSNYPKCNLSFWYPPINEHCPKCNSLLIEKSKKLICSNNNCDYNICEKNDFNNINT